MFRVPTDGTNRQPFYASLLTGLVFWHNWVRANSYGDNVYCSGLKNAELAYNLRSSALSIIFNTMSFRSCCPCRPAHPCGWQSARLRAREQKDRLGSRPVVYPEQRLPPEDRKHASACHRSRSDVCGLAKLAEHLGLLMRLRPPREFSNIARRSPMDHSADLRRQCSFSGGRETRGRVDCVHGVGSSRIHAAHARGQ